MATMVKHVGRIKNTDRKCIVVFRYIYDEKGNITDKEHCLVVDADALPDMFNQAIIDAVNSSEGQDTLNFYEVLARRSFSDGRNMLATLDATGRLNKYHTNDITMVPHPAHKISLTELNRELEKLDGVQTEEIATAKTIDTEARGEANVELTVANDESSDTGERTPQQEAEMLRFQADRFEVQAKEFRAKADAIDPDSAKPRRGRPPKAATEAVSEATAS
jgi:hypothetical protein